VAPAFFRPNQTDKAWKANTNKDRFRRGMYTYFWRSAPYPALTVFDAPSSTNTCTRRIRSNTPLQALTTLNDQAFHEFAGGLARRILREAPATDKERIRFAFRLCLSREPSEYEHQRIAEVLGTEIGLNAATQGAAQSDHSSGDASHEGAWVTVARVLLNLDEFLTRE